MTTKNDHRRPSLLDRFEAKFTRHRTPDRLVVIAATPRTGSSLLFTALQASGMAGNATEYFNPANFAWYLTGLSRVTRRIKSRAIATERASTRSVRIALKRIADAHTTPEGTLSLKIMWSDLESVLHGHSVDFDAFGVPIIWIRIRRDDHVAQAVSYARAAQTLLWRAGKPESTVPVYDGDQIAQFYARIQPENDAWDAYLAARCASPIQVTYEELDSDYEGTVRRVLDGIGATGTEVPPRQLSRQRDHLNAEWAKRFRATLARSQDFLE
jgi:trehalose 2-sulfotransferase